MVFMCERMIEIKLFKDISFKGYTFIEGFPGAGLVGPMTISYIIDKLDMKYVGYLQSDSFPPLVSVHKNEPVPPIRIYCTDNEKIMTIFAEFAITIDLVSELSKVIYDFIKKQGIKGVYSIGGIPSSGEPEDKTPFIIASNKAALESAKNTGLRPVEEGVATGVSALILVKSAMDGMNDVNIMVPVQQNIIDPIYAVVAIQSLNKLMSLNIDVTELDKEAKAVEAKIKELINKHKETHENYKKAIDSTGPSMYA
jgi:uncharacterized protein